MKIKEGYKIRNIAGEHVIVSIGTLNVNLTKVVSLNPSSVWLWEQLSGTEFDAGRVADLLTEHYEVERPGGCRNMDSTTPQSRADRGIDTEVSGGRVLPSDTPVHAVFSADGRRESPVAGRRHSARSPQPRHPESIVIDRTAPGTDRTEI